MTQTLLKIAQVFGGASVMLLVISFVFGLLHTLSIKGALEYVKSALVIPFIILPIIIVCSSAIYVIFTLLDLPYL